MIKISDAVRGTLEAAGYTGFDADGTIRPQVALKALRLRLSKLKPEARNILVQIEAAGGAETPKQTARLAELEAAVAGVEAAIDEIVDGLESEGAASPRGSRQRLASPDDRDPANDSTRYPRVLPGIAGGGQPRYFAELFGREAARDQLGFESFQEFVRVFGSGLFDPRLQSASQHTGDADHSGYLVPSQYLANLMDASLEQEIVRPRADVVPMETNEANAPAWDTTDHSSNIGGLTGVWLAEGGTATDQTAKFRNIMLRSNKLAIYCAASNEIVQDGVNFGQKLESAMAQAIGWSLDYAYLNGSGVGQPRGVLSDPALIVVPKESGQGASTIKYANLANMYARVHPQALSRAVWVANPTTVPQLLQLFATDGSTSTHVPVLREDGAGGFTMLTRPVFFTEKVPALGTQGDISLIDFSQYVIGMRKVGGIQRSQHVGWHQDQENFRLILRTTGQGKWKAPITPKNGSTLSWCVTLQAR